MAPRAADATADRRGNGDSAVRRVEQLRRSDIGGRPDVLPRRPAYVASEEFSREQIARPISAVVVVIHLAPFVLAVVFAFGVTVLRGRSWIDVRSLDAAIGRSGLGAQVLMGVSFSVAVLSGLGLAFPVEFRWLKVVLEFATHAGLPRSGTVNLLDEIRVNVVLHQASSTLVVVLAGTTFLLARRAPVARVGDRPPARQADGMPGTSGEKPVLAG